MLILLILFILIPLIEIYLFIVLGSAIGAIPTILLCLTTAVAGAWLVKLQGLGLLFSAQQKLSEDKLPANELFEGLCVLLAGAFLITPGFFTDSVGFLLLIPATRTILRDLLLDGLIFGPLTGGWVGVDDVRGAGEKAKNHFKKDEKVIEAEYTIEDEQQK